MWTEITRANYERNELRYASDIEMGLGIIPKKRFRPTLAKDGPLCYLYMQWKLTLGVSRVEGEGTMKKLLVYLAALVVILNISVAGGVVIGKYEIFPYIYLKKGFNNIKYWIGYAYGPWSIGIYTGPTPFDLADTGAIQNPVLTGKDVDDIDARFVADPFMILEDGEYTMFFEVMNRASDQGDIGYATSTDGINWAYGKIIIDEDFHLSYPYVFKWNDNYYLIPESHEDWSLRLYVASSFPEDWKYVGDVMGGQRYVDASPFRYKDKWWLFSSPLGSEVLNLYYSDNLRSGWKPHAMNPIVKFNKHTARPGGRVLVHKGRAYRFTQDDAPSYGIQVFAFEITELSEDSYADRLVSEKPVVTLSGKGWNAAGMHHVDVQLLDGRWIAAVDGRDR